MKRFAAMFEALDSSNSTLAKLAAVGSYFKEAAPADAAWAAWFLTGHRPRQVVPTRRLVDWAAERAGLPLWLFEECYGAVGDLGETMALVLPPPTTSSDLPLQRWVEERLVPLRGLPEAEQRTRLEGYWDELDTTQRFVFTKLITGEFRIGVSSTLATRAIAEAFGLDAKVVAHRLMGEWWPTEDTWGRIIDAASIETDRSNPYPFYLASPLEGQAEMLGPREEWLAEWKWDGIRAQLIRRGDVTALWSRGEEPIAGQFPELMADAQKLPDCVIDGEILAWQDNRVMAFAALQKRLGRKNPGKKVLTDSPVIFLAFDLLEWAGEDWRERPLAERRQRLKDMIYSIPGGSRYELSSVIQAPSWESLAEARATSRELGTEGVMLKRISSPYRVGRPRGDWWKWKIEPYTLDAVLIYAQRGHGKRASLYTDYTFGLWKGDELVPFAKAYSGLTDAEIRDVDAFIRKHTTEKFGPVRVVKPELVFELGFEGIQRSKRHKSGIAVRFPRMLRMRTDKTIRDANTLEDAFALAGIAEKAGPSP
jgi:DNA ligase 1